jgi:FecR protein
MGEPLDKLVREARDHFGTREAVTVDWRAVDDALFARLEQEARTRRTRAPVRWWPRALVPVALSLSAVTIALFVVRGPRQAVGVSQSPVGEAEDPGDRVSIEGSGQATVQGVAVSGERQLRLGDVVETQGSSVTLERPGKVSMTLEANSRIRVSKMRETLVLVLERGAVEAQVTPVAHGEAFAVDVEGSRVAVHGTHLRVRREDWRVIVDVNEGVIAVGDTPRSGLVLGAVVVASAHAEFMAFDALGTLKVSRDPAALRWPAPSAAPAAKGDVATAESHAGVEPASSRMPLSRASEPRGEARASAQSASASPANVTPEADLAGIVRKCMADRPRAENVTILVRTTLHLILGDDGWVQSARFDPPVAPDVNACAAQSIYRTHFDHGGNVTLSVDFKN